MGRGDIGPCWRGNIEVGVRVGTAMVSLTLVYPYAVSAEGAMCVLG